MRPIRCYNANYKEQTNSHTEGGQGNDKETTLINMVKQQCSMGIRQLSKLRNCSYFTKCLQNEISHSIWKPVTKLQLPKKTKLSRLYCPLNQTPSRERLLRQKAPRKMGKNFEIGQGEKGFLGNKQGCREIEVEYLIEIASYNETDYYCKTLEGRERRGGGRESHQWFKASELNGFKASEVN